MTHTHPSRRRIRHVMPMALLSVSYLALAAASPSTLYAQPAPAAPGAGKTEAPASPPSAPAGAPASPAPSAQPEAAPSSPAPMEKREAPAEQPGEAPLPPVTIYPPHEKPQPPVTQSREAPLPPVTIYPPRAKPQAKPTAQAAPAAQPAPATRPRARAGRAANASRAVAAVSATTVANAMQAAIQAAWPASGTQDAKTGTSGVYTNSTSAATKINTPIVNIPQSLSVVTKEFIADNAFQNITDVTRYVPGVDVHQGEGNRDELIIRGVDSSANFFVNGFRDDVQIFRDFYNAQSVEILKGPSAITFGRSSGGVSSTAPSRKRMASEFTRRRCRPGPGPTSVIPSMPARRSARTSLPV